MAGLTTTEVIRCLRDGSRDMTQVIFRQIPEKDIFNPSGTLRGQPLYRVNYCGDNFCSPIGSSKGNYSIKYVAHQPKHDHIMWCRGDEGLFRCRVALEYSSWTGLAVAAGATNRHENWVEGQKEIMALPQLYLTGLRR